MSRVQDQSHPRDNVNPLSLSLLSEQLELIKENDDGTGISYD